MNAVIVSTEIISVIFMLLILAGILSEYHREDTVTGFFIGFLLAEICGLAVDIAGYLLEGHQGIDLLLTCVTALSYIFTYICALFFAFYLLSIIRGKRRTSLFVAGFVSVLAVLNIVLIILGVCSGRLFSVSDGVVIYGPWINFVSVPPLFCMIFLYGIMFGGIGNLGIKRTFYLGTFIFLTSLVAVLMIFFPDLDFFYVSSALACFIIFIFIQTGVVAESRIREQTMQAANKAKSDFLAHMSHEIRTPINTVLGMDELILRDTKEKQTYEYAESIRSAGSTLLGIISDLLDFSIIEAGKMEIIPAEYDPAKIIHDLIVLINIRAEKKGIRFSTDIDRDLPRRLYGDGLRIKQILSNLLTNAIKYTERGSVLLEVSYKKADEDSINLHVSVRDTGIGIKEVDIKKLTLAFERGGEKEQRNIEGTGIGLSITDRLLTMMGSKLMVSSEYGEGSDFYFDLKQKVISWEPVGDPEEYLQNDVQYDKDRETKLFAPGARILAVDDTPLNLKVFKGLLEPTGISVDTAENGSGCIEMLKKKRYNMIFLDHRMPGMDGIETLGKIRKFELIDTETPVIALTANAVQRAREDYLSAGFDDYLAKPINSEELIGMIIKHLPESLIEFVEAEDDAEYISSMESAFPIIDGMDERYAAMNIPNKKLLYETTRDYYLSLGVYTDKLDEEYKKLPDEKAFSDYRTLVHGMKSSAAMIGIIPLAGMAKVLENAARDKDEERIRKIHNIFISECKEYRDKIKEAFRFTEEAAGGAEFDPERITELLDIIETAMDDFDVDSADEAVAGLREYSMPDALQKEFEKLYNSVIAVDDEGAAEAISTIRRGMKEIRK